MLSSEQDYLEFIEAIHPSSNYLSYDYKCMTHCYYISDTEIRSTVERASDSSEKHNNAEQTANQSFNHKVLPFRIIVSFFMGTIPVRRDRSREYLRRKDLSACYLQRL